MKKIFLTALFTYLIMLGNSQFSWLNPYPNGNWLKAIVFPSEEIGFAVGDFGTIFKTKNGGDDWNMSFLDASDSFLDCDFPNVDTGYVCGFKNVYKTTNCGDKWEKLNIPSNLILSGICFTDAETGFAIGYNGIIIKTEDGGSTWNLLETNVSQNLTDIKFIDKNIGYVSGKKGVMLKTKDGGKTWISVNCNFSGDINSMQIFNSDSVISLGNLRDELFNYPSYLLKLMTEE